MEWNVIHAYTRADALRDGNLVAVPDALAREAGITVPVALTRAAWEDCVAWTGRRQRPQGHPQRRDRPAVGRAVDDPRGDRPPPQRGPGPRAAVPSPAAGSGTYAAACRAGGGDGSG
jgi:hypothetical protein